MIKIEAEDKRSIFLPDIKAGETFRFPEENEIFRQIIDDRPTSCLVLKNVLSL